MDSRLKAKIRKDLIKIRSEFSVKAQDTTLQGYCAICSYAIWKYLKKMKLNPEFRLKEVTWEAHCYVLCDNHIIDITAKQFGSKFPNVVIRKNKDNKEWFWSNKSESAKTVTKIKRLLDGWVHFQKPKLTKTKKKNRKVIREEYL